MIPDSSTVTAACVKLLSNRKHTTKAIQRNHIITGNITFTQTITDSEH